MVPRTVLKGNCKKKIRNVRTKDALPNQEASPKERELLKKYLFDVKGEVLDITHSTGVHEGV